MSKKTRRVTDKIVQNSLTKVLFIDKSLLHDQRNDLEIVSVELPRKTSLFVKSSSGSICELLQFNEKYRSWFLDDTVCSNGRIYVTTKIDPLFVFLQYLEKHCISRAQPLDQLLHGTAEIFSSVLKLEQMKLVADQKGPDNLKAFVFNEEKTLKWLKKKFKSVVDSLRQQKIISSGASSMNFVKSSIETEAVDEDTLAETALGIISEYISLDLIEKLEQAFDINSSKDKTSHKRKSEIDCAEGDRKRLKFEEQENLVSPPNIAKKEVKITTKSKALEKAAKGSKSISSFFTKK